MAPRTTYNDSEDRQLSRAIWDDGIDMLRTYGVLPVTTMHPDEQRGVLCIHMDGIRPSEEARGEAARWGIVRTWPNSFNRSLLAELAAMLWGLRQMVRATLEEDAAGTQEY